VIYTIQTSQGPVAAAAVVRFSIYVSVCLSGSTSEKFAVLKGPMAKVHHYKNIWHCPVPEQYNGFLIYKLMPTDENMVHQWPKFDTYGRN
jgi:hypothetical protein